MDLNESSDLITSITIKLDTNLFHISIKKNYLMGIISFQLSQLKINNGFYQSQKISLNSLRIQNGKNSIPNVSYLRYKNLQKSVQMF